MAKILMLAQIPESSHDHALQYALEDFLQARGNTCEIIPYNRLLSGYIDSAVRAFLPEAFLVVTSTSVQKEKRSSLYDILKIYKRPAVVADISHDPDNTFSIAGNDRYINLIDAQAKGADIGDVVLDALNETLK